ncbi:solute carrier family 35 member B1 homolog isoform X1 [Dendroctonus ponderosae]|uniref:solute carrier family 35 member B1 homolog isoform X2 n=1 Tax=Dendroctonus ponderosae TaxID=77166 RepID=UPI002034F5BA|nr:solute carrier family 35 member B1 homolog isoform X2 [Dendroctonus ponderosae]XP_048518369.1 solute carrier family 35 member B1 homolog isoform X1 [Dendroctonus ponderosae]
MKADSHQTRRFIFYALGIFTTYFYFGILLEKVTRAKYEIETVDSEGNREISTQRFPFAITLVCTQCFINYVVARAALYIWPQSADQTSKLYYSSVSVTYLLAMLASNMALQWVPYPTQVVGKSAKPIPVLVLGVLVGRKSYTLKKYLFVFIIVLGVVLFMLKDNVASSTAEDSGFGVGELLLILSLVMDGLTGAIQERIRAESKPTGLQMMLMQNGWSSLYLIAVMLITGESVAFLQYAKENVSICSALLFIGLASALGQLFIFSMVSEFGPLVLSIVTTTRKFFTVLGSVVFFGNTLTERQWIGAFLVFFGLFLDAYYAKGRPKKEKDVVK